MSVLNKASSLAALTLCESILHALREKNVFSEGEIANVFEDAIQAHLHASGTEEEMVVHSAVVALLEKIAAGQNSIRI